ncbi:Hypothetical protein SMAX5B_013583 [Scophthalmus maximus]|uniref:BED-type domain-containing protein n=1 Tax=Scophthalmus maximus TaxID=52904 RepID=A0A2U9CAI0_SCOMX|nr:Hypothetical protein SMAX5B_013583 [Scophthalmus maximus]
MEVTAAWRRQSSKEAPYEHLYEFYDKGGEDGNNLTFLCKRTSATSTPNLKRHIELKHPASLSRSGYIVISQPQLDNLVVQYIVGDLQPLSKQIAGQL